MRISHIIVLMIITMFSCTNSPKTEDLQEKRKPKKIEYTEELKTFKSDFKIYAKDFFKLTQEKEKTICSFGVATDEVMLTFLLYYNTKENLVDLEALSTIDDKISNKGKEQDIWNLSKWDGNDVQPVFELAAMAEANAKIQDQISSFRETMAFSIYRDTMFQLFCDALKELREEGFFEKAEDDFLLLVQENDNFIAEKDENNLRKIMSDEQWKSYLEYNSSWLSAD